VLGILKNEKLLVDVLLKKQKWFL